MFGKLLESSSKAVASFASGAVTKAAPTDHAGHAAVWALTPTTDKATKLPATRWSLDLPSLAARCRGTPDAEVVQLAERLREGVKIMTRMRHPRVLRVLAPLVEKGVVFGPNPNLWRGEWVFVSERVVAPLTRRLAAVPNVTANGFSRTSTAAAAVVASTPVAAAPPTVDDIFFAAPPSAATPAAAVAPTPQAPFDASAKDQDGDEALLQLRATGEAVAFLHAAGIVHLNLCPDSIVVCADEADAAPMKSRRSSVAAPAARGWTGPVLFDVTAAESLTELADAASPTNADGGGKLDGPWKLADFTFCCRVADLNAIPSVHCDHLARAGGLRVASGGSNTSAMVSSMMGPALDWAAPELVLENRPSLQCDVFSFTQLAVTVLNRFVSPSDHVTRGLPRPLRAAQDVSLYVMQLSLQNATTSAWGMELLRDPARRPSKTIKDLLTSAVTFDSPAMRALQELPTAVHMDDAAKVQIFHTVFAALPSIPRHALISRVVPNLLAIATSGTPIAAAAMHRYIAPLAIHAMEGGILSVRAGAHFATPRQEAAAALLLRLLLQSTDVNCAVILFEAHRSVVPLAERLSIADGTLLRVITAMNSGASVVDVLDTLSSTVGRALASVAGSGAAASSIPSPIPTAPPGWVGTCGLLSAFLMRGLGVTLLSVVTPATQAAAYLLARAASSDSADASVPPQTRDLALDILAPLIRRIWAAPEAGGVCLSDDASTTLAVATRRYVEGVAANPAVRTGAPRNRLHDAAAAVLLGRGSLVSAGRVDLIAVEWVRVLGLLATLIEPRVAAQEVLPALGNVILDVQLTPAVADAATSEIRRVAEHLRQVRQSAAL